MIIENEAITIFQPTGSGAFWQWAPKSPSHSVPRDNNRVCPIKQTQLQSGRSRGRLTSRYRSISGRKVVPRISNTNRGLGWGRFTGNGLTTPLHVQVHKNRRGLSLFTLRGPVRSGPRVLKAEGYTLLMGFTDQNFAKKPKDHHHMIRIGGRWELAGLRWEAPHRGGTSGWMWN